MAGLITAAGSIVLNRIANSGTGGSADQTAVIPDPNEYEQGIIDIVNGLVADYQKNRDEESGLRSKMSSYSDLMLSDSPLSPEEEAAFDQEYELQLSALNEQYGQATERSGAARMAELASRGVLETTTGQDTIAEDQRYNTEQLSQSVSALLNQKEVSRSEAENAKREMARTGYELTSGMLQSRQFSDLSTIGALQDYSSSMSRVQAQNKYSKVIREQQLGAWKYNRNLSDIGKIVGAGAGGLAGGD